MTGLTTHPYQHGAVREQQQAQAPLQINEGGVYCGKNTEDLKYSKSRDTKMSGAEIMVRTKEQWRAADVVHIAVT